MILNERDLKQPKICTTKGNCTLVKKTLGYHGFDDQT